jgi:myosin-5
MGIGFVKEMYFESAILIHRQLEDELQAEKSRWQAERDEFMQEIERLKEDNDRQQKLLSVNLTKSPQTQTEAFMQHEITRLTSENLVSLVGYDEITWFT